MRGSAGLLGRGLLATTLAALGRLATLGGGRSRALHLHERPTALAAPVTPAAVTAVTPVATARAPAIVAAVTALLTALAPGLDFSREIRLTREHGLGDVSLVRRGKRLVGWALWHSAPLAEGRPGDETRVLKVVAEDDAAFEAVSAALLAHALEAGRRRVGLRAQTAVPGLFNRALDLGWRVHWTDLRMTLENYPRRGPVQGVVMSNWEI